MSDEGALLFAQYAYPPNELGYCGPPGARSMLDPSAVAELESRARQFEGAWAYLELLAEEAGFPDPLDRAVVEAYWVGSDLLDSVDPARLVTRLEDRFRGQPWGSWHEASDRARAHHSFQVYEVYPWVGMLLSGKPPGPCVEVLDRCRIRVGDVVGVDGEAARVRCRPLAWDGAMLVESEEMDETARWSADGASLIAAPQLGDQVALHWDWVCEVVSDEKARQIRERERSAMFDVGLAAVRPAG
jgi:hypothetical protein